VVEAARHLNERGLLKLLAGEVSAEERRGVFEHLRACPACAETYEIAVEAERAMTASPDEGAMPELDALLPGILDEVAPAPRRANPLAWLAPVVAVAAGALIFVSVGGPDEVRPPQDEFQARTAAPSGSAITLYCVEGEAQPLALDDSGRCSIRGELVVALSPARTTTVTIAVKGGPTLTTKTTADGVAEESLALKDVRPGPAVVTVKTDRDERTLELEVLR
jgi:anti-sigma factor RsiW